MDAMLCIATHLHLAPSHSRGLLAKLPENLEKNRGRVTQSESKPVANWLGTRTGRQRVAYGVLADVGEEVVVERRRHPELLPPAPRLLHRRRRRRSGGVVGGAQAAFEACRRAAAEQGGGDRSCGARGQD